MRRPKRPVSRRKNTPLRVASTNISCRLLTYTYVMRGHSATLVGRRQQFGVLLLVDPGFNLSRTTEAYECTVPGRLALSLVKYARK